MASILQLRLKAAVREADRTTRANVTKSPWHIEFTRTSPEVAHYFDKAFSAFPDELLQIAALPFGATFRILGNCLPTIVAGDVKSTEKTQQRNALLYSLHDHELPKAIDEATAWIFRVTAEIQPELAEIMARRVNEAMSRSGNPLPPRAVILPSIFIHALSDAYQREAAKRPKTDDPLKRFNDIAQTMRAALKPAAADISVEPKTSLTFDDVGGCRDAKEELRKLARAITHREAYKRWGSKLPKGILLYGPPGTGKTLLAEVFANAVDLPFVSVASHHLVDKYIGESAKNVSRHFEGLRKLGGGILFVDEAESVICPSGGSNVEREFTAVRAAFKVNMTGKYRDDGIYVLFAANDIEFIDKAVMRAGRVDKVIKVPLPNTDEREEIIRIHCRLVRQDAQRDDIFDHLDIRTIADATTGMSGAAIAEAIRKATECKADQEALGLGEQEPLSTDDIIASIRIHRTQRPEYKHCIGFC